MRKLLTRKHIRLKDYDYALTGYYYVTICSKNRENIFGEIINNKNIVGAVGPIPVAPIIMA